MPPEAWDVVIVGAGPAGSSLAARLGARGWSVLLLDSAHFPRDKMCGEYLGAGCLPLLGELGAMEEVLRHGHHIRFIVGQSPGGRMFRADYPRAVFGLSLSRRVLDGILLERARLTKGVQVREGFRVEGVILAGRSACGVRGRQMGGAEETPSGRLIIGADGRNSIVARGLHAFRWHTSHRKLALGVHYEGVEGSTECAEIYAGRSFYGILNHQRNGSANVSIVVKQAEIGQWKGRLDEWFHFLLLGLPGLKERLATAKPVERVRALGPLAHYATRVSMDGALLVGDAAGFYDPFTGEGVYMALEGARLAAEVADSALRANDTSRSFLRRYDQVRASSLAARYRVQTAIQAILSRPWLADAVTKQLHTRPRLADRLLEVIGDLKQPGELQWYM